MAFSVSGLSAVGANEGLQQVLERRLKEAQRADAERQRAIDNQMQRQSFALQQETAANLQKEREETRARATRAENVGVAGRTMANLLPGTEVDEETAKNIALDPANAGLVAQRKIINAMPRAAQSVLPGTVAPEPAGDVGGPTMQTGNKPMLRTIDASPIAQTPTAMGGDVTATQAPGGQAYGSQVYRGTPGQIEEQRKKDALLRVSQAFTQPGLTEDQKLRLLADATGAGLGKEIPSRLTEPSEIEKRETELAKEIASEDRAEDRWLRQQNWSLRHQREHPQVWVTDGKDQRFVTPSDAAALSRQGWRHAPTGGANATEDERKSAGFYKQMTEAIQILDEVEGKLSQKDLYQIQSLPQEDLVGLMNRGEMSEAAKRYMRAFEQFTEARLRPVSGAAIADTEFARDRRTYAKQYGETAQLNKDRRAARQTQVDSLRTRAGRAMGGDEGGNVEYVFNPATGQLDVVKKK